MPNFPEPSYGGSYWGGQSYGVSRPRNDPNHHIQSVPAHAGTSIRQHDQYPLQGSRSAQQRLINNLDASVIQDNLELLHKFEQFSERAEPEFNNFVRWANERGINLKQNLEGGQLNFWRWGFVPQHDQRQIGNFVDRLGYLRSVASRSRVENDNPIRDVFLPCRPPLQGPGGRSISALSYYEKSGVHFSKRVFNKFKGFVESGAWRASMEPQSTTSSSTSSLPQSEVVPAFSVKSVRAQAQSRKEKGITHGMAAADNNSLLKAYTKYFGPANGKYNRQADAFLAWTMRERRNLVVSANEMDEEAQDTAIRNRNNAITGYYATLAPDNIDAKDFIEDFVGFLEEVQWTRPSVAINTELFKSLQCPVTLYGIENPQVLVSGHSIGEKEMEELTDADGMIRCPITRTVQPSYLCVPNHTLDDLTHNYWHYRFMMQNGKIPDVLKTPGTDEIIEDPVIILQEHEGDGETLEPGTTIGARDAARWGIPIDQVHAVRNHALREYIQEEMRNDYVEADTVSDDDGDSTPSTALSSFSLLALPSEWR
ncbi:hypothetical protein [Duganella sp. LjRoot269]|jgi:hypothetical protein|uniref:hypothetical protein n=1 Tax=Duganella sp. LjRoot269 TaxID=3342305 RepID=UPI003ECE3734